VVNLDDLRVAHHGAYANIYQSSNEQVWHDALEKEDNALNVVI
jgi:hypothetical protein